MPVVDIQKKLPPLLKRRNVLQLLVITLLAEIGYGVLNFSTMPVYLRDCRGFGESIAGLIFTTFLLSEAVFKGTMGHLADKYGKRRMMVIGPAITTFTPLLTLAIPSAWGYGTTFAMILLRVLDGLAAAMLWPAAYALMGDICDEGEKQEGMSLLNTCFMLGIALAMPIGGMVNDLLGENLELAGGKQSPSFYLATVIFVCVAFSAFFFVPSGKDHRQVEAEGRQTGESELHMFFDSIRVIPQYLLLGFVTFMGIGFPMLSLKWFALDQYGMGETAFGMLVLPGALAMAITSVPMGRLGVRIGAIRAIHLGMLLCVIGLGIIAAGAWLPFMRSAWAIAVGGIPLGAGFLLTIPAWYTSVSNIDSKRKASNIGAVMTAQGLGAIVGAPLGTMAYEHLQSVSKSFGHYSPFVGSFICVAIGLVLGMKILHERPNKP